LLRRQAGDRLRLREESGAGGLRGGETSTVKVAVVFVIAGEGRVDEPDDLGITSAWRAVGGYDGLGNGFNLVRGLAIEGDEILAAQDLRPTGRGQNPVSP